MSWLQHGTHRPGYLWLPRLLLLCLEALNGAAAAETCAIAPAVWAYLPPSAFDHTVTVQGTPNGWNNLQCAYDWRPGTDTGATANTGVMGAADSAISFHSPMGCMDPWGATPANGSMVTDATGKRRLSLHFSVDGGVPVMKQGTISPACDAVDMDDGGLYIRGVHPIDQAPHEWIKSATAWLVRAAQVRFADGTVHLTPGYPSHYNGQWMRDSFYGISNAWDLANATRTLPTFRLSCAAFCQPG